MPFIIRPEFGLYAAALFYGSGSITAIFYHMICKMSMSELHIVEMYK